MDRLTATLKRLETAIEEYCASGSGRHKQRVPLFRNLGRYFALFEDGEELRDHQVGAETLLARVSDDEREFLAAAAFLISRYDFSLERAASKLKVSLSAIRQLKRILRIAGLEFRYLRDESNEKLRGFEHALEEMTVLLEQRALEDILLASLESYAIGYTETYGLCFGNRRNIVDRERAPYHLRTVLSVLRVATQIRAKARASWVAPNEKSFRLQRGIAEQFFEHLELVGDYHSHPYRSLEKLRSVDGWEPSRTDTLRAPQWAEAMREEGSDPWIFLIAAVAKGGKTGSNGLRVRHNRIQFCMDRHFVVIGAYRIRRDGQCDDEVFLHCPQVPL